MSSTQITCSFDLTGAATGTWDVTVTNPDTQSGTLAAGFTVTGDTTAPEITTWAIAATHAGGVGQIVITMADGYIEPRNCGIALLRVCFTEPLDPATVDTGVIAAVGVINGDCSAQVVDVTLDGSCIWVEFSPALPDQDTYEITVSTAVCDLAGNPLDAFCGDEFTLEVVPEPTTIALFGLGLLDLGAKLRRRRAS